MRRWIGAAAMALAAVVGAAGLASPAFAQPVAGRTVATGQVSAGQASAGQVGAGQVGAGQVSALIGAAPGTAPTAGLTKTQVKSDQARLNRLGCDAGPVDGVVGLHTRSATWRFQSANRLTKTGGLNPATRSKLHSSSARTCWNRPLPAGSGAGRRIVLSQGQNFVWLVRSDGSVARGGHAVDNPSVLSRGTYYTGSKCGRVGRILNNHDYSGRLLLRHFVRFAPCGIGFHAIPTYVSNGRQIHPGWLLGTNYRESHGCIRLSPVMAGALWNFTTGRTKVVVVG